MEEAFMSITGAEVVPGDYCIIGDRLGAHLAIYKGRTPKGYYSFSSANFYHVDGNHQPVGYPYAYVYRSSHTAPPVYRVDNPSMLRPSNVFPEDFFTICRKSFDDFRRKVCG